MLQYIQLEFLEGKDIFFGKKKEKKFTIGGGEAEELQFYSLICDFLPLIMGFRGLFKVNLAEDIQFPQT